MQLSFTNPATNPYGSVCLPFTREGSTSYDVLRRMRWEMDPVNCMNGSYQSILDDLMVAANGIVNMTSYFQNPGGRAWG